MNAPHQDPRVEEHPHYGFVIGLAAGTIVGAGLALWLAPRLASELRQRATDSARDLGQKVSGQYHRASDRVGAAVEDLTRKTDDVRDGVADAVVRGAQEVERLAVAARSDRRR
jgi:gas vesicle protein